MAIIKTILWIIKITLHSRKTKYHPIMVFFKYILIFNSLNNQVVSCSFINLNFLLLHTTHLDKNFVFSLLTLEILGFIFLYFCDYLNNRITYLFFLSIISLFFLIYIFQTMLYFLPYLAFFIWFKLTFLCTETLSIQVVFWFFITSILVIFI